MKLTVVRADPAGNTTLFVRTPLEPRLYGAVGEKLLALPEFCAEQVGFISESGRLEMAGGEFCGNATRAFGLLTARERGISGRAHLTLSVSGCEKAVGVDVDTEALTACAEMPLPLFVRREAAGGIEGTLVHLGGIVHFVVRDIAPSEAFFAAAEPLFASLGTLDAYGVIFCSGTKLTPLVRVPAVNSLLWEGSCGSGSLAAAIAESEGMAEGIFEREYVQPAGVIRATVERRGGKVAAAYIGGSVTIDEPVEIEL